LVETFSLSISLGVISGGWCNHVIKEFSEGVRELGDELGATIRDNLVIEAEPSVHVFEEKFRYPFHSDSFQARHDNYLLCKAVVDHDHDRVEPPRRRQISDEVDRQGGKGHGGSRGNGDQRRGHRVGIGFHLLTKGATLNIFTDIGAKARPPKVTLNKLLRFKMAGMARCGVVM
jgi:hypothetical protein